MAEIILTDDGDHDSNFYDVLTGERRRDQGETKKFSARRVGVLLLSTVDRPFSTAGYGRGFFVSSELRNADAIV